jgi:hypothetical protein
METTEDTSQHEYQLAARRRYRQTHQKEILKKQRIYRKTHPEVQANYQRKRYSQAEPITQRPFKGNPFILFLIDLENLRIPYINKFHQYGNFRSLIYTKLIEPHLLPKVDYLVCWFGGDHLTKYQFTNRNNKWFGISLLKWNKDESQTKCIGADTQMVATGIEYLIKYPSQIQKCYVGSGDIDLYVLHEKAFQLKIPTGILCFNQTTLHEYYKKNPAIKEIYCLDP